MCQQSGKQRRGDGHQDGSRLADADQLAAVGPQGPTQYVVADDRAGEKSESVSQPEIGRDQLGITGNMRRQQRAEDLDAGDDHDDRDWCPRLLAGVEHA
ncbi:Uncharacterised protein [Mycobacterium tuberculosis]|uniref:Uncharacterized protein n=1 Tax=Mycobacterium tuberculosis TaxID=1773 RepID=A0A655A7E9_MYCTX|nr:Uncharacterised protein [Mycobacterium tuberculosis]CFS03478.1 Uncharacterised protein [Mycobacterium tuberculosis]CKQ85441.1 Uncharacterised protein [Mycobacterium tuberculosis]CKR57281.1 Uncharacterised protein [Mycobacterium tuberculosis]CKS25078.1 Uncharacterised protein [Mycobacterium tuberculosis]